LDGDPEELASLVTYPCVAKPRHLSGSRGVIRADHPAEFVAAFRRTAQIIRSADPSGEPAASATLLVEAYLPGSEHALEGLLTDGDLRQLALFDKPDPLTGPHFEETLYVTPSRLSLKHQDAIFHAVAEAVGALGLTHGAVHAEVRVGGGRVWILEIAARSIGGLCSRALRFEGGRSLEEILLAHAVGFPLGSLEPESPSRGVMMIPIPQAGVLERVVGLEEARSTPLVEDLVLTLHPGQPIVPLPEGAAYLGFIFARGEKPAEVEQALRNAHACLRIEVGS
jgi:biotin carboxylase